ncbi:hypothetical protein PHLCEN_2v7543 [Hermanssonia centrifuga]|uniref:Uncharacterized protein n=1 Tax=Hermanssonia centrifuga TaxID=98765 RepID=A0A2R6NWD8_9APHY|nr:hypothetical protein PHLCEN_2v7543 [Hermanssonia centrifuga]
MPGIFPEREDTGTATTHFTPHISPKDWNRFQIYAPRIKSLCLFTSDFCNGSDQTSSIQLSYDAWVTLSSCKPPGPLLPNLKQLFWFIPTTTPTETTQAVNMFLGPKLRVFQLQIDIDQADPVIEAILHLPWTSPSLQTLGVGYHNRSLCERSFLGGRHLQGLLGGLGHLQEFRWACVVSPDQLSALLASQPRSLRRLSVGLDDDAWGDEGRSPSLAQRQGETWTLPNLTELELHARSSLTCSNALRMCNFPRLAVFVLSTALFPSPMQVFQTLCDTLSHTTLHTITLKDDYTLAPSGTDSPVLIINPDTLQPLYAFRAMTSISFSEGNTDDYGESRFQFSLNDTAVLELAMAWPQLKSLRLGPSVWDSTLDNYITLKGLKHLVQHCQYLVELRISILVTEPSYFEDTALDIIPTRCNELITKIDFIDSSIGVDSWDVAAYLHVLFPRLVSTEMDRYLCERDEGPLEEVEKCLLSIHKAHLWRSRILERGINITATS